MEENYLNTFVTSRGGLKLNVDGFTFEKNRVTHEKQYWACDLRNNAKYKCKARIITSFDKEVNKYKLLNGPRQEHNHEPDALKEKVQGALNKIKEDALTNINKKPIHIISDCESSTSSSILSKMPTNLNLRQMIYRQRNKKVKITEPDTIDFEIDHNILQLDKIQDDIILIDKSWSQNKRIILYTTRKLLAFLCASTYLIMDGTFKVTPKIFRQVYTVHGCINSKTFPLVIALCTNKDKSTYDKLFSSLIEYCQSLDLILSPKYILMDFEKASQLSAKYNFENTVLKGCYFHLGQIIYRQVQNQGFQKLYGTDELFSSEIKCLLALAYLPAGEIPEYFEEWQQNISSNAKVISDWFSENYIMGTCSAPPKYEPDLWSTYDLNNENIPRTQNSAESWHNRFQHLVGQHHAGFYFLSRKIALEMKHQTAEIEKHLNGAPPAAKKRKYNDKADRTENLLKKKGEYSNKSDFLNAIATNIKLI